MSPSVLILRVAACCALCLGAAHALGIVLWYARRQGASPRRVWHVVSVGLGIVLLYEHLFTMIVASMFLRSPLSWQSPKVITAVLFIGCGAQLLYDGSRTRKTTHR